MEVDIQDDWQGDFSNTLMKALGWKRETRSYRSQISVDLSGLDERQITLLFEELSNIKPSKESREAIATIKRWREVLSDKNPRASNAKSATDLIAVYVAKCCEGFRLWKKVDSQWFGFFVNQVWFEPESQGRGGFLPATANINLLCNVFGETIRENCSWNASECRGKTAIQLLAMRGFVAETPEIMKKYHDSVEQHIYFCDRIGLQCNTSGVAFLSGNYDSLNAITCDSNRRSCLIAGMPGLVVVDTVDDDPDDAQKMRLDSQYTYNQSLSLLRANLLGVVAKDEEFIYADEDIADQEFFIPIHPLVPVFDLIRHERYAVHSLDMKEYMYDQTMAEKLILPEDQKRLLSLLVASKGNEFKDIVASKSGGTVVLLAGRPGLGKTLSAEVFSECSQRPLYRVQCSQLGIDSDTIENELKVVFRRARRWNAVILLDEADLYIGERGTDITRNAIVCVFLRVLESSDGVLFLTTNLPETVDDAIASRCIARIDVKHPDRNALRRIWDVLLQNAEVAMSLGDVEYFCEKYSTMGGRDVKAAIKLAMVNSTSGKIGRKDMEFVLGFHPNRGQWSEQ